MWKVTLKGICSRTSSASCSPASRSSSASRSCRARSCSPTTIKKTFDDLFADIYKQHRRGRAGRGASSTVELRRPGRGATISADLARRWCAAADGVAGRRRQRAGLRDASSTRTATRSAARAGRADPRLRWDRRPRAEPVHARARAAAPARDDEIVIDKGTADEATSRSGDTVPVLTKAGREGVRRSSASSSSATPTACSARPSRVHAADAHAGARRAGPVRRRSASQADARRVAGGGRRDVRTALKLDDPGSIEVVTGEESPRRTRTTSRTTCRSSTPFLLVFARGRAARRLVHHLQHVLDHRRAAHPRDGAAARASAPGSAR